MSEISRRGFLGGMGAVALGLLFRSKASPGKIVTEPEHPKQAPSAIDIVARPQRAFRPERLVVPVAIAPLFVFEHIMIGSSHQFAQVGAISASMFSVDARETFVGMDAAASDMEVRFRVRYVGDDPRGARFQAALFGTSVDGGRCVLPIDSGVAIVA